MWAWVSTRAEQATTEGLDVERAIKSPSLIRNPWDVGAVKSILPELAKTCAGFDWTKPANNWSKDELAGFLLAAFNLIQRAMAARDVTEEKIAGKPVSADVIARQTNGSIGNPRMTVAEFNDVVNF